MAEISGLLLKTVGLGLLTGFVFGYLFKKVTKIIFFLIAIAVVLVFILGHNEILDIDWLATKDSFQHVFDRYIGDEVENQVQQYSERMKVILSNLPFTISLIIGVFVGLSKG